jgi:hypothetical protein
MYSAEKTKKALETLKAERQHALMSKANPSLGPMKYPSEGQYFDTYLLNRLLDLEANFKKAQDEIKQLREQIEAMQNPPQRPGSESGGPVKKFGEM